MGFKAYLPFLHWFPMKANDVRADLIAGLTVAMVLVPQSMAYAELAGLPVWMGLYAAFLPVILAGLWGSSRHLQTGPGATMAFILSSVLVPLAAQGSEEYMKLAVQLGFMVGIIWALMATLRLGFIINFISRPVIEGFINAGAILIVMSQLDTILGIECPSSDHVLTGFTSLFGELGSISGVSLVLGASALLVLILGRRYFPKVPLAIVVAIISTGIVYALGLSDSDNFAPPLLIVGEIPAGLPKPIFPVPNGSTFLLLLPGALTFAMVGFIETSSVAQGIAARSNQKLNVNREVVGQSLASFAAAFSGGQPINGSLSRTALSYTSGARSGLAAVFTGLFVLVFLLFFTPVFYYLPKTVLSAIIIAAVIKLINFRQLASFLKVKRGDGVVAWITFLGTLLFAPHLEWGILLGTTISILLHLYRMMRPNVVVLGLHSDGALREADLHELPVTRLPMAIRLDGRLFFANVAYVEDQVHEVLDDNPDAQFVAIMFDGINDIDSSGTEMLKELYGQLSHRGVKLLFVGVKNDVLLAMQASGLEKIAGQESFFGTYEQAQEDVLEHLETYTI